MAISITVDGLKVLSDSIEVVVCFLEEAGPPYHNAYIRVFLERRDWLLTELEAAAIAKAKAFVLQAASSPQS
jgi:hypothetical protein